MEHKATIPIFQITSVESNSFMEPNKKRIKFHIRYVSEPTRIVTARFDMVTLEVWSWFGASCCHLTYILHYYIHNCNRKKSLPCND